MVANQSIIASADSSPSNLTSTYIWIIILENKENEARNSSKWLLQENFHSPIKSAEFYAFSAKLKGSVSELPDEAVCGFAIRGEREDWRKACIIGCYNRSKNPYILPQGIDNHDTFL